MAGSLPRFGFVLSCCCYCRCCDDDDDNDDDNDDDGDDDSLLISLGIVACGFKGTLEARTSSSVVITHVIGGVAKLLKEEAKKSDDYSGVNWIKMSGFHE